MRASSLLHIVVICLLALRFASAGPIMEDQVVVDTVFKADGTPKDYYTHEYDTLGNDIKSINYNYFREEWKMRTWEDRAYDSDGNLIARQERRQVETRIQPMESNIYLYDDNGNQIVDSFFRPALLLSVLKSIYDAEDIMVTDTLWSGYQDIPEGKVSRIRVYAYEDNGNHTVTTYGMDSTGAPEKSGSTKYEVDTAGNVTKKSDFDENDSLTGYTNTEYDAKGNVTKVQVFAAPDSIVSTTTYEYNAEGDTTTITNFAGADSVTGSTTYEYDDKGRLVKKSILKGTTLYTYTTYTYSDVGVIFGRMQGTVVSGFSPLSAVAVQSRLRGSVQVSFGLSRAAQVAVRLFDSSGRIVRTLAERGFAAGRHTLHLTEELSTGCYFVYLTAADQHLVERTIVR